MGSAAMGTATSGMSADGQTGQMPGCTCPQMMAMMDQAGGTSATASAASPWASGFGALVVDDPTERASAVDSRFGSAGKLLGAAYDREHLLVLTDAGMMSMSGGAMGSGNATGVMSGSGMAMGGSVVLVNGVPTSSSARGRRTVLLGRVASGSPGLRPVRRALRPGAAPNRQPRACRPSRLTSVGRPTECSDRPPAAPRIRHVVGRFGRSSRSPRRLRRSLTWRTWAPDLESDSTSRSTRRRFPRVLPRPRQPRAVPRSHTSCVDRGGSSPALV